MMKTINRLKKTAAAMRGEKSRVAFDQRGFERALNRLVSSHLEHAELDEASEAMQDFIDRLSEIEDRAQGF